MKAFSTTILLLIILLAACGLSEYVKFKEKSLNVGGHLKEGVFIPSFECLKKHFGTF